MHRKIIASQKQTQPVDRNNYFSLSRPIV